MHPPLLHTRLSGFAEQVDSNGLACVLRGKKWYCLLNLRIQITASVYSIHYLDLILQLARDRQRLLRGHQRRRDRRIRRLHRINRRIVEPA